MMDDSPAAASYIPTSMAATILSIESQVKSLAIMLLAPSLGLLVDKWAFAPLGITGLMICLSILLTFYRSK